MRLYDTAERAVVDFSPGPEVRMYVCGITPYDSTHLGHANTYLTYDLLTRRLEDLGHHVRLVRNITDVDDSILPRARELGVDFAELAETEVTRFRGDMAALNTIPPEAEPRATEWIAGIVDMIARLAEAGHVYSVDGTSWFDVSTWPRFGSLARLDDEKMRDLAARRGGTPDDPRQRNPLDFVLWKPSLPDEPVWDSPLGPGRPGWHIECSTMASELLGSEIDLHGGGSDLVFPHHECEQAQSEAATGHVFARHWMHCGMVAYEGRKMSKSLGNLVFVSDLLEEAEPAAVRLALMGHHYRDDWEWRDGDIDEGAALLDKLFAAALRDGGRAEARRAGGVGDGGVGDGGVGGENALDPAPFTLRLRSALDDDLDAPRARSALLDLAGAILAAGDSAGSAPAALRGLCALCGIRLPDTPSGTTVRAPG